MQREQLWSILPRFRTESSRAIASAQSANSRLSLGFLGSCLSPFPHWLPRGSVLDVERQHPCTQHRNSVIDLHDLGKDADKMTSQDLFQDYIPRF